ncbi:MAG TPA: hypothetical protein VHE10_03430 [Candidatus Paceibacterota bacterium]|nr:hypothetical protein [Candidatus Paceibacterota bacterium]
MPLPTPFSQVPTSVGFKLFGPNGDHRLGVDYALTYIRVQPVRTEDGRTLEAVCVQTGRLISMQGGDLVERSACTV